MTIGSDLTAQVHSTSPKLFKRAGAVLLLFSTLIIFAIAESIRTALTAYDIGSLFISFCAGFILFTPLISLVLHPFAVRLVDPQDKSHKATLLANIGLVLFVQLLFFLIWMTDAVALYSMYVDQSSFLAQAFNIQGGTKGEFSQAFLVFNLVLAWLFSLLSIVLGLIPCLVARIKNQGVVGNIAAGFSYAKSHLGAIAAYALVISIGVLAPLLYAKYLFLLTFPASQFWVFKRVAKGYLASQHVKIETE